MADATEREREARDAVKDALRWCSECGDYTSVVHPEQGESRIDAYRAAVRARVLADVIAALEGELIYVPAKRSGTVAEGFTHARNRTLHYLLDRLRAMEPGA